MTKRNWASISREIYNEDAAEERDAAIRQRNELLEMLIRVRHELEYPDDFGDDLNAVIAKATGGAT